MPRVFLATSLILAFFVGLVACEAGKPTEEAKKEEAVTKEMPEPPKEEMATGEAMTEESAKAEETALLAPAGSAGQKENDEGVDHYGQGHFDVAEGHFRKAIKADAKLAEAHFNLALALDKLDKHGEATEHFKKAAELAPDNPKIADSPILKKHTGA